jgi:membrane protease subunit (stomatin/prohibitin family)
MKDHVEGGCLKSRFTLSFFAITAILMLVFGSFAFASEVETTTVPAGYVSTLTFNLQKGQTFSGSLSISGGSGNDVDFHVTNPQGVTIVNSGRVSGGTSFSFTADSAGAYTLHFDNSFSLFSSKDVRITYDVSSPFLPNIGGTDLSLILLIVGIVLVALIVIVAMVLIARSKSGAISKPTSQSSNEQKQESPQVKYCTQCGTANDASALFCKKCGKKFNEH